VKKDDVFVEVNEDITNADVETYKRMIKMIETDVGVEQYD